MKKLAFFRLWSAFKSCLSDSIRAKHLRLLEQTLREAQSLVKNGRWAGALDVLNTVSPQSMRRADYQIFRARILLGMGRDVDALSDIDEADGGAASPRLLSLRAEIEERLGRVDAAIQSLTRALEAKPDASILARRAVLLQGRGQFEDAREDLTNAITLRPREGELYRLLSTQHRFTKDDPFLKDIRLRIEGLSENARDRVGFDFAYAKALDEIGEFDAAFAHLKNGNAQVRRRSPYDIKTREAAVRQYKNRFATFDPAKHQYADPTDYAPIFITGMPRSGTTLVEQILSSHAQVQAGGETALFRRRMVETLGDPEANELHLSPEKFRLLGQRYHADMLTKLHIAKRHTDKSLQTLLYAGPVAAALPKAKIVVVTRHPNAVALSLFKQMFRPGKQLFSYSLDDIRAYQDTFDDLVSFWTERLPDMIHIVAYEDVVATPKETIAGLLQDVGLDWDDACLRPEKNTRAVRTLSAVSVREAISVRARDHWRNYEKYLAC